MNIFYSLSSSFIIIFLIATGNIHAQTDCINDFGHKAKKSIICPNENAVIQVLNSQTGVTYVATNSSYSPIGLGIKGNGGTLDIGVPGTGTYGVLATKEQCFHKFSFQGLQSISAAQVDNPTVSISPAIIDVCSNTPIERTFTASGSNWDLVKSFTWTYTSFVNNDETITSSSYSPYTRNDLVSGDQVKLTITYDNQCSSNITKSSETNSISVKENKQASFTLSPEGTQTVCGGGTTTFHVTNTSNAGSSPTFQWYKGDVPVGNGGTTYSAFNDFGFGTETIRCKMTSSSNLSCLSKTKNVTRTMVENTVQCIPFETIEFKMNGDPEVCEGESVQFSLRMPIDVMDGLQFRLYDNDGNDFSNKWVLPTEDGTLNFEHNGGPDQHGNPRTYKVLARNLNEGNCCPQFLPTTYTVVGLDPIPMTVRINPGDANRCDHDNASPITFHADITNPGTNLAYEWRRAGYPNPVSYNSFYGPILLDDQDVVTLYATAIESNCNTEVTDDFSVGPVIVTPALGEPEVNIKIAQDQDLILCPGEEITFEIDWDKTSDAGNNPIFQWSVNDEWFNHNSETFTTKNLQFGENVVKAKLISNSSRCLEKYTAVSEERRPVRVEPPYVHGQSFHVYEFEGLVDLEATPDGGIWYNDENEILPLQKFDATIGEGTYDLVYEYVEPGTQCAADNMFATYVQVYPNPSISPTGVIFKSEGADVTLSIVDPGPHVSGIKQWFRNGDILSEENGNSLVTDKPGSYYVNIAMKGVVFSSEAVYVVDGADLSYNSVTKENPIVEVTDETAMPALSSHELHKSIAFFDGLGRGNQTVLWQASPGQNDLISSQIYDGFGRASKSLLPYTDGNDGEFKHDAATAQATFYESRYLGEGAYAFSETVYEESPLNRVEDTYAPGTSWSKEVGNRPITTKHRVNASAEVTKYLIDANGQLIESGTYNLGLTKTITSDENGHQVIEYTNKKGQVVLKKVEMDEAEWAETYYVYDDFGNLRFVLPPKIIDEEVSFEEVNIDITPTTSDLVIEEPSDAGSHKVYSPSSITLSPGFEFISTGSGSFSAEVRASINRTAKFNDLAFEYRYDERHRMVEKKVPGSDWVYMVYDDLDRLVLTQDGNQRVNGEWIFTKYDVLNRPIMTGIYQHAGSREEVQILANGITDYDEAYTGTGVFGYDNTSFPSVVAEDVLTVSYYDAYGFAAAWGSPYNVAPAEPDQNLLVKGQPTGALTRMLDGSMLKSVIYYDDRYRTIKTISENHLSGEEIVTTNYKNLVSSLIESTTRQHTSNFGSKTITDSYTYDHSDRLLTTTTTIDGVSSTVTHIYDELGQLIDKDLDGAQSVDYAYNIRGWVKTINNGTTTSEGDQFGMELLYADAPQAQYNGNIGAMRWQSAGMSNPNPQQYDYSYDQANRLQSAIYDSDSQVDHFNVEGLTYDHNGNITALSRNFNGKTDTDVLSYDYQLGNQLTSVTDNGDATDLPAEELDPATPDILRVKDYGFLDGNETGPDYAYDANGNMIEDKNKGITVSYNHLNLPERVDFDNGDYVVYTYDAAGTKLKKESHIGANVTTTDYVAGIQYENDVLDFMMTPEGKYKFASGAYEYNLTDHLGNVRVTVDESGNVLQSQDYYPFGLSFNSYTSGTENLYKYNGKEEQEETGWYDYGARMYDAALGRFFTKDRFAEKYSDFSPYQYGAGNPIKYIDVNGDSLHITGTAEEIITLLAARADACGCKISGSGRTITNEDGSTTNVFSITGFESTDDDFSEQQGVLQDIIDSGEIITERFAGNDREEKETLRQGGSFYTPVDNNGFKGNTILHSNVWKTGSPNSYRYALDEPASNGDAIAYYIMSIFVGAEDNPYAQRRSRKYAFWEAVGHESMHAADDVNNRLIIDPSKMYRGYKQDVENQAIGHMNRLREKKGIPKRPRL